jgi:glucose/arabinose dehydrogenase
VALTLKSVVSGLSSPVGLVQANDGSGRFFIVQQAGTIRILQNGTLASGFFLDIRSKVDFGGEKGLLGLAFHPSFPQNRRFFVNYVRTVNSQIQTVIAEYQASATNPNQADPASERILLLVDQPFGNHKGGQLAFGPDNFLYIGLGDGGSGGDPMGNGQNLQTLLGKMLRIDVDGAVPYGIPGDNPFAGGSGGARPEIWAYGLRNPWRFSFDVPTARLFCADVGQAKFEEVDLLQRGGNFGWNIMEGAHCFEPATGCNMTGLILPIFEYAHGSDGDVVIGGFVYHGASLPQLANLYIFGDFESGKIWSLRETAPGAWQRDTLLSTGRPISSFGQDQAGEIFVVDYSGVILQLTSQ